MNGINMLEKQKSKIFILVLAHSYPAGGNWSRTAQLRCAVLSLNPRACALEQTSFNIYGNYKTSYTKSI